MRKMCQSQQFVTWDVGFCHMEYADVFTTVCQMGSKLLSPRHKLSQEKIKNPALSQTFFFSLELEFEHI